MKRFVRTNIGDIRTSATLIVEVFSFIHTCYAMDILIIGKVQHICALKGSEKNAIIKCSSSME